MRYGIHVFIKKDVLAANKIVTKNKSLFQFGKKKCVFPLPEKGRSHLEKIHIV